MRVIKNAQGAIVSFIPCCKDMTRAIAGVQTIEIVCDSFVIRAARFVSDPISFCPFCGKELEEINYGTETQK